MIPGIEIRAIKRYLPIDRMNEGYNWVNPEDGESFVGIPCGYYEGLDISFIEVWKGDILIRTVNCADCSEIVFSDSRELEE